MLTVSGHSNNVGEIKRNAYLAIGTIGAIAILALALFLSKGNNFQHVINTLKEHKIAVLTTVHSLVGTGLVALIAKKCFDLRSKGSKTGAQSTDRPWPKNPDIEQRAFEGKVRAWVDDNLLEPERQHLPHAVWTAKEGFAIRVMMHEKNYRFTESEDGALVPQSFEPETPHFESGSYPRADNIRQVTEEESQPSSAPLSSLGERRPVRFENQYRLVEKNEAFNALRLVAIKDMRGDAGARLSFDLRDPANPYVILTKSGGEQLLYTISDMLGVSTVQVDEIRSQPAV